MNAVTCSSAELALIRALPRDIRRVTLIPSPAGTEIRSCFVVTLQDQRPDLTIVEEEGGAAGAPLAEAVLFLGPIPHTPDAVGILRSAHAVLEPGGLVVAYFRNGLSAAARAAFLSGDWLPAGCGGEDSPLGQYAPNGVSVVLSRASFDVEAMRPVPEDAPVEAAEGWVVGARARTARVSPFGEERRQRRARAKALNDEGEKCYAAGDVMGATAAFAKAIELWNEEAVFFNNLATALFSLGYYDDCWRRVCEALHLNPNLKMARDNLRAIAQAFGRSEEAERLLQLFGRD